VLDLTAAVDAAGTGVLPSPLIKALIFTASVPFSVLAVTVTVFEVALPGDPLPLKSTVNFAEAPGANGSLLQS
jgi:hypothetical protein